MGDTRPIRHYAGFLSPLQVEHDEATEEWVLLASLVYRSEVARDYTHVPAGFRTDFSSVPRLPLAYLVAGDTAHAPSVVHDYLYRNKIGTRKMADAVFYEAMIAVGEPKWRAWLMWSAVRAAGWATWRD
jgi:hypothetical protein